MTTLRSQAWGHSLAQQLPQGRNWRPPSHLPQALCWQCCFLCTCLLGGATRSAGPCSTQPWHQLPCQGSAARTAGPQPSLCHVLLPPGAVGEAGQRGRGSGRPGDHCILDRLMAATEECPRTCRRGTSEARRSRRAGCQLSAQGLAFPLTISLILIYRKRQQAGALLTGRAGG